MPVVMQIKRIALTDAAKDILTASAYEGTKEWLTYWTPEANFKTVFAQTRQEALDVLKKDLTENLVPPWLNRESKVNPEYFEFEVSEQEIEDNRFWMPSSLTWCHWHKIPSKEKCT